MHKLFTYGTLQNTTIQKQLIGRELQGTQTKLNDCILGQLFADDGYYPCIYEYPNACVYGTVYEVTGDELILLDEYEGDAYKRVIIDDYYVYVKA